MKVRKNKLSEKGEEELNCASGEEKEGEDLMEGEGQEG